MKQQAFGGWGKTLFALFERYKFVLLVILAGAALLLLPSPKEEEGQPPPAEPEQSAPAPAAEKDPLDDLLPFGGQFDNITIQ